MLAETYGWTPWPNPAALPPSYIENNPTYLCTVLQCTVLQLYTQNDLLHIFDSNISPSHICSFNF